ncbi:hypothetical protein QR680_018171 [Steinernema hermaphroditum]|uniref:F-box domain-containing protein n=1 Tax=Steinernema hermaphroditum TaxID=289476 RepID=A0AA39HH34_9BILA|nr:hypothetical protein QR680_018171 [Steinernema hermaphroditum]
MEVEADAECRVLQVSNVSPYATEKECRNLFEFFGKIDKLAMYPSAYRSPDVDTPKIVYVMFESEESVHVAQHLTETTFMDRPLVCVPAGCNRIPDEQTALGIEVPPAEGVSQFSPKLPSESVEKSGFQLSALDMECCVLQVSNVSPYATEKECRNLFEFIGKIDELAMYPSAYRSPSMDTPKIVYVKFESKESVRVAQHLTETTFMDRPLVCVPAGCNQIPDEQTALARGVPQPPPTVESDGSQMFSPAHHDKDEGSEIVPRLGNEVIIAIGLLVNRTVTVGDTIVQAQATGTTITKIGTVVKRTTIEVIGAMARGTVIEVIGTIARTTIAAARPLSIPWPRGGTLPIARRHYPPWPRGEETTAVEMARREIGSDLPFDVIRHVLSLLPRKALLKLRLLNREWNRFVLENYLGGILRVRLVVDFRFAPVNTFVLYTNRRRPWNAITPEVLSSFRSHVKVVALKCVFPRLSYPANITYVDIMLKDLRRLIAAHHKVFNRLEDIRMGDCFKGKYPWISPERVLYRGRIRRFLNMCRGEYLKRDKTTLVSKRFFHLFTLFHRTLKRFDLRFGYDYTEKNFFLNIIWALSQNPRDFTGVFSTELYEIDAPFYRQIYGSDYVMEVKPDERDKSACLILVRKVGEVEKVKQETFRLIREELSTRIGQEIVDNRIRLEFLRAERIGSRIHYFVSVDTCPPQKLVSHAKKRLRTLWKVERNVTAYIRIHYNWDYLLRLVFLNQDITRKLITNKPEQVSIDKFRDELSAQLPKSLRNCFSVQLKRSECVERSKKIYEFCLVFQIPSYMRRVTPFDPHCIDVQMIERNVEKYLSTLYGTDFAIKTEVIYRVD